MEEMDFKNKTIFLISPEFQNIHKLIVNYLENRGAKVIYHNANYSQKAFYKALNRLLPSIMEFLFKDYYLKLEKKYSDTNIDILFVIKGEILPVNFLKKFKEKHANTKLILYLYDSIKNYPNILTKTSYFDRVLSFDRCDCQKYCFDFRPLFFANTFNQSMSAEETIYDFTFIGTDHSGRFLYLNNFYMKYKNKYKIFFYFFIQSKYIYYFRKITNRFYRQTSKADFNFNSLSHDKIAEIYKLSKVIVDIQQLEQVGLSMRTLETIASKKKLYTTNKDIVNYDFFNENNIKIIEHNDIKVDNDFLKTQYVSVDDVILQKYSLHNFLRDCLLGGSYEK